jgi:hypothetical protein
VERRRRNERALKRIRVAGMTLGMALAVAVVGANIIPAGAGVLGADISMVVAPTGELGLKHSGVALQGTGLTPTSDHVTGQFQIMDQTMFPLSLRLRGIPDTPGLDHTLWVSLSGPKGTQLFRGTLGDFRAWTENGVTLEPGVWQTFGLSAWLPADAGPGYVGRMVQVDLGFSVTKEPSS